MTETGNTPSTGTVFAAEGLSKSFGGTTVLDRVSLELRAGEILAVVGQNGSGKSTLVKLMSGYHQPDAGEITVGERESFRFVHQNLGLISNLSVVDNLALELGYQTAGQELAPIHWRRERARARDLLLGVGLEIDPEQLVEELTVGERALVALARALGAWSEDSRVLVLDEPTVSLSQTDTLRLFNAVRSLTEGGIGVLCVLHSVHEVLEFADRVLVLRDGKTVALLETAGIDHDGVMEAIVGQAVSEYVPEPPEFSDQTRLSIKDLSGGNLRDFNLNVNAGEIVGIAGLVGSGVENLMPAIQGVVPRDTGSVELEGVPLASGAREMIRQGVVMVPADREGSGCIGSMTVQENVMLPDAGHFAHRGFLTERSERGEIAEWIARLQVRPADADALLEALSGGNQQKVVLAKWLRMGPKVLLLEEPTQGVDVGAKRIIYEELGRAARAGSCVLIASQDHEELARVCERVVILREGTIGATLKGAELNEDRITTECMRVGSVGSSTGPREWLEPLGLEGSTGKVDSHA